MNEENANEVDCDPGYPVDRRWVVAFFALPRMFPTAQAAVPRSYQTVNVEKGSLAEYVSAVGKVRSNQTTILVWQTNGIVEKVNYSKGQVVNAKAVLAELEQTSLSQAIIMAQADLVRRRKRRPVNTTARAWLAVVGPKVWMTSRTAKAATARQPQTIDIARANLIRPSCADQAETNYDKNKNRNQDDLVTPPPVMLATAQQKYTAPITLPLRFCPLPDIQEVTLVAQASKVLSATRWSGQGVPMTRTSPPRKRGWRPSGYPQPGHISRRSPPSPWSTAK
jgi:multidrug efflux pump subunit AcrA (membrane-fusion protein)